MKAKANNFNEALQVLGIEKYAERIWHSNSHGELFHLEQYVDMANAIGETDWFAEWVDHIVKWAEKEWDRPESVFQHLFRILSMQLKEV